MSQDRLGAMVKDAAASIPVGPMRDALASGKRMRRRRYALSGMSVVGVVGLSVAALSLSWGSLNGEPPAQVAAIPTATEAETPGHDPAPTEALPPHEDIPSGWNGVVPCSTVERHTLGFPSGWTAATAEIALDEAYPSDEWRIVAASESIVVADILGPEGSRVGQARIVRSSTGWGLAGWVNCSE